MKTRCTILITGAASGIGRETALLFARKGWYVGLYDVNRKGLESLRREIGARDCCRKVMDVSAAESVEEGVKHFLRNTGGVMNVLFNNAGVLSMGAFENMHMRDAMRIIDVNLKGTLNCIHASLGALRNTKNSRIINMSSASALYGTSFLAVYSATKAAVCSLTESLNVELGKYGIIVSDVRAPFVKTPLLEKEVKAPVMEKLGVHLTPEEVAMVVWKAVFSRKIHKNTRGVAPLLALIRLPDFIFLRILKFLVLPRG
ncbi:MAG TPA: SDR family oxidoreductase [Spirochaetota bacterium]|nr:SDR family oxidoreductase [Spirochaetota bacterium]